MGNSEFYKTLAHVLLVFEAITPIGYQELKLIRPEEAILATMLLIQCICPPKKLQFSNSFDKFKF